MIIYLLILILPYTSLIGQDVSSAPLEAQTVEPNTPLVESSDEKQKSIPLPELGTLKLKYLSSTITLEELYRLASFYLAEQQYHQASELYGQYIELTSSQDVTTERLATAYFNRALSLFALNLYDSSLLMFQNAYHYNNSLNDTLRMIGTIYFLQKNKEKSLEIWTQYIETTPDSSPHKQAIQNALNLLLDPNFTFETEKKKPLPKNQQSWPFLNPDIIPNPDAKYQKKRVV